MKNNKIQNNVFGNLNSEDMQKIEKRVIPDSRIRLCSSLLTPSREIVPIAEALVAYDTRSDQIVKFIAAFVPQYNGASHMGIKFLLSKTQTGNHKPVVIAWHGEKKEGTFWSPHFLTGFLDYAKLPMMCEHAEFRVLRAYRSDLRAPARFELLTFTHPGQGKDVDKRTMRVEMPFNSVPPINLVGSYKGLFWWQKEIVTEMSRFSGVNMLPAIGIGIGNKLTQAVQRGIMSAQVKEDILHDHSEDPVEVTESLGESFGVRVKAEDGKDFYVPENPLVASRDEPDHMDDDMDDDMSQEEYDLMYPESDKSDFIPANPMLQTMPHKKEEEVVFFD